ncbi:hypothetical protein ACTFIU_003520 [Dictyostelium citrinum]
MNYVEKLFDEVHYVFNLNAATLSGAIDILVIPQLDGSLKCTPFHVRFGKLQLIQSSAKVITIYVNGQKTDLQMKLGQAGEAFFVEESDDPVPPLLATSPIPSPKSTRRAISPASASTTTTTTTTTSSSSSSSSSTTTSPVNNTSTTSTSSSSTTTLLSPSIQHITHTSSSSTTTTTTASTSKNSSPIPSTTTKFTQKSGGGDSLDSKEMKPLTSALEEMILNQTINNNSFYNYIPPQAPTTPTKNKTPLNTSTSTLSRGSSRPSSPVTIDTQSPIGSFIIDCGNDINSNLESNTFSPSTSPPKSSTTTTNSAGGAASTNNTTTSTTSTAAATSTTVTEPVSDSESEPKFWRWGGFPKFTYRRKQSQPPQPTTITTTTIAAATTLSNTTSPSISLATSQDSITDSSITQPNTTTTNTIITEATTTTTVLQQQTPPTTTTSSSGKVEEILDTDNKNSGGESESPLIYSPTISSNGSDDGLGIPINNNNKNINNNNNNKGANHSIPIPTPNNTPINPSMLVENQPLEGSSWTRMGSLFKMFKKDHSGGNNLDTLSTSSSTLITNDKNNNQQQQNQQTQPQPSFIVKTEIKPSTNFNSDNNRDEMFLLDEEQEQEQEEEEEEEDQIKQQYEQQQEQQHEHQQEQQHEQQNLQQEKIEDEQLDQSPKPLTKSLSYADIVKEGEHLISTGADVLSISPSIQPQQQPQQQSPPKASINAIGTTVISTLNYPPDSSISECLSKLNYESEFPVLKTNEGYHHHSNSNNNNNSDSIGNKQVPPLQMNKIANNNGLIDHFSISLSLCGHLILDKALQYEPEEKESFFREYLISFEHFCSDTSLLKNPHLVAKINDQYYPWSVAGHIILSYLIYRRPITQEALNNLKKKDSEERANVDIITPLPQPTQQPPQQPTQQPQAKQSSYWKSWLWKNNNNNNNNNQNNQNVQNQISPSSSPPSQHSLSNLARSEPIPFTNNKNNNTNNNNINNNFENNIIIEDLPKKYTKKSLRPTSDQLKSLGLKKGINRITFVVSSTLLGTKEVSASIYYWDNSSKIVISDIDGTITKSDVFGQVLPLIGKDWSHIGVAELYSNIKENGYQIIYLTSRAIGQANLTRTYISSVKQTGSNQNTLGGTGVNSGGSGGSGASGANGLNQQQSIPFTLPEGPVFMSPNRLLTSFNREVIKRNPEEFKIACLQDIQNIFPPTMSPFYAGFGNRNTDAISYNAVGVPKGKTFTINPLGVINTTNTTYNKTYTKLNDLVQDMFPCQNSNKNSVDEQWNEYHYWKKSVIPLHKLDPL